VGGRIRGKKGRIITLCDSDNINTNFAYYTDTTTLLMIVCLKYKRGKFDLDSQIEAKINRFWKRAKK
jgi:hypothetical protein